MDVLILSAYLVAGLQLPSPPRLDIQVVTGVPITAPLVVPSWKGVPVQLRRPSGYRSRLDIRVVTGLPIRAPLVVAVWRGVRVQLQPPSGR